MSAPDARIDPKGRTIKALLSKSNVCIINTPPAIKKTHILSQKAVTLLKGIEELATETYDDQTGKKITQWVKGATIGYGHLISKAEWDTYKNGITKSSAEKLLNQDLKPFVNAVNSAVKVALSQNEFDALVIFTFNTGIGGFRNSSVLKLINDPSAKTPYKSLELAWKAWNKSQGKVMRGLKNRRNSEWNIFENGLYKRW
ncbi:lysozyme [Vibrio sp. S9_S30]|nr:lysozyme [Vibrio sp. S9_S30]